MSADGRDDRYPARHLDPGRGLSETYVALPDGRRLRAVHAGGGNGPLVLFEAGMSSPAALWAHTQREISAHARTLAYDRAGYGGSDPDPADRTLERIADDLAALLDGLGEARPVVLVGHSWGGPILRLFAERHPQRVAALVLVDSTVAEIVSERAARLSAWSYRVMSLLVRAGGKNLITKVALPHGFSPAISADDVKIMLRDYACVGAMRTGGREAAQILPSLPVLRRLQAAGTPDVPTICLQGGRVDRGMAKTRPLLNRVAAELMSAVRQGRVEVVDGAGHLIPQEKPEAVRAAVLEVVDAVSAAQA